MEASFCHLPLSSCPLIVGRCAKTIKSLATKERKKGKKVGMSEGLKEGMREGKKGVREGTKV